MEAPAGRPCGPRAAQPSRAGGSARAAGGGALGWAGGSDSTTQVTLRLSSSISPIGHHSGTSADGVLSVPSAGRRVLSEAVPEPSPALRLATPRRARWHPRSQARRPEGRGGVRGRPRALRLRPPRSSTARPCLLPPEPEAEEKRPCVLIIAASARRRSQPGAAHQGVNETLLRTTRNPILTICHGQKNPWDNGSCFLPPLPREGSGASER